MAELKRLNAGEVLADLPGGTWNRFVDATGFVERERARRPGAVGGGSASAKALTIYGKNATGGALSALNVVGIDDCILSPANDASAIRFSPRMKYVAVAAEHATRFAIVQDAAKSNQENVAGIFRGVTWAKVNIVAGGDKTCGIIAADKTKLISGKSGATILWAEKQDDVTKTGEQWCVIDIDGAAAAAIATGVVVTADAPKATYNRTLNKFTPGYSATCKVKPLVAEDPTVVPPVLIYEQTGGADLELPVLNYTQSTIYFDAEPQRQVFGFRTFFDGVEYFCITDSLRGNTIHGAAVGAVASGTATFSVDGISVMIGSGPTNADGTAATSVTVNNTFGFAIDDDGLVRCVQSDDGTWECVQAKCPA